MIEPYLASINMFAGNFAPRSFMFCQGQLLSIAEFSALFALLGTTYGGDGQVTFALPDFRGRRPIGYGQGPGLSNYYLGEMTGNETITLISSNLPSHSHIMSLNCSSNKATSTTPQGNFPAVTDENPAYNSTQNANMPAPATTGNTGGSNPVSLISPYLAMNFVIAVEGIFPSRN
jgi:microcystin-dependent protein